MYTIMLSPPSTKSPFFNPILLEVAYRPLSPPFFWQNFQESAVVSLVRGLASLERPVASLALAVAGFACAVASLVKFPHTSLARAVF